MALLAVSLEQWFSFGKLDGAKQVWRWEQGSTRESRDTLRGLEMGEYEPLTVPQPLPSLR